MFIAFKTSTGARLYTDWPGVAYVKNGAAIKQVALGLTGTLENDQTARIVDLSIIKSLKVVEKTSAMAAVVMDLFPDISAEELLRIQPSYTQLKEKYAARKVMRIALQSPDGRPLVLVGRTSKSAAPMVLAPFSEITEFEEFERGNLWWAIGSVSSDPAYPFREVEKK